MLTPDLRLSMQANLLQDIRLQTENRAQNLLGVHFLQELLFSSQHLPEKNRKIRKMADNKQSAVAELSQLSTEDVERKVSLLLDNTSIAEAQIIEQHVNRNDQFHQSLTPRQIHVISLGSNIGSGVFFGTGKALANGGPGNTIIAYALGCSCLRCLVCTSRLNARSVKRWRGMRAY